jgi:hypothetical protein
MLLPLPPMTTLITTLFDMLFRYTFIPRLHEAAAIDDNRMRYCRGAETAAAAAAAAADGGMTTLASLTQYIRVKIDVTSTAETGFVERKNELAFQRIQ